MDGIASGATVVTPWLLSVGSFAATAVDDDVLVTWQVSRRRAIRK